MTARTYLIESVIPSTNGNIDGVKHGWAWAGDDSTNTQAQIAADLTTFYTTTYAAITSVSAYFHPALDGAANRCSHTFYDLAGHLDGTPHGPPIGLIPWTLTAPISGQAKEPQIAAVWEYNANLSGISEFGPHTRPRSRRRGRQYLGPLNNSAVLNASTGPWDSVLSANLINVLKAAAAALLVSAHFGPGWGVWSRKDAAIHAVVGGWIDSTPHVQRRRQDPSGIKTLWP